MHWSLWCLFIGAGALALTLLTSLLCFLMVFYSKKRTPLGPDEYEIPPGEIYEAFREDMVEWTKKIRSMPHEDMEITSFDGLKLRAKYYEYEAGAPIEILFHGYKGYAERDLSGGVERCFRLGRNVILVDQRASGRSDGHVITFGIREYRDCHSWVRYAIERFGEDVKLIIGGVSMGAATVMMAAGEPLPKNVLGVLADCGYTSPKEIICKVVKDMRLPPRVFYPFIKLGARIFGRFDLEQTSPIEAMRKCTLPIVFVHGDTDDFVPYSMSVRLCDECAAEKKTLITIKGAGHGLAFPADRDGYVGALVEIKENWNLK